MQFSSKSLFKIFFDRALVAKKNIAIKKYICRKMLDLNMFRISVNLFFKTCFIGGVLLLSPVNSVELMNYYICKDIKSANSCSEGCINSGNIKFTILNNDIVKNKNVKSISYYKKLKEIDSSGVLNNCKIESVNNWLCQEIDLSLKTNSFNGYKIYQMVNGVFSFQSNLFSKKTTNSWSETFACAKVKKIAN